VTRRKAALGHLAQPALVADFWFSRPAGFDPKQSFALAPLFSSRHRKRYRGEEQDAAG
jgi:hypothetical protein